MFLLLFLYSCTAFDISVNVTLGSIQRTATPSTTPLGILAPGATQCAQTLSSFLEGGDETDRADDGVGTGTAVTSMLGADDGQSYFPGRPMIVGPTAADGQTEPKVPIDFATNIDRLAGKEVQLVLVAASGKVDYYFADGKGGPLRAGDAALARHAELLLVAAAGDDGTTGTAALSVAAHLKNGLAVGSVQNSAAGIEAAGATGDLLESIRAYPGLHGPTVLSSFSSRGPTADGRIKPDLVAVGEFVSVPSGSTCAMRTAASTSLAAAHVLGAAGVLADEWADAQPSAALLRAALIYSAVPLDTIAVQRQSRSAPVLYTAGGTAPSFAWGHGRVSLDNLLADDVVLDKVDKLAVAEGQTLRFCVTVPAGGATLVAALAWTDAETPEDAGRILVNDADLAVYDSAGHVWHGNGGAVADTANNVEKVTMPAVPAGRYVVAVHGARVSDGPLRVSLVVGLREVADGDSATVSLDAGECTDDWNFCAGDCGAGECGDDGLCTCDGSVSVDCSGTPCPNDCSGNGVCLLATGTCACNAYHNGTACDVATSPPAVTLTTTVRTIDDTGITAALYTSLAIVMYFVGCCCAFFCGGFIGAQFLRKKRERQAQQV